LRTWTTTTATRFTTRLRSLSIRNIANARSSEFTAECLQRFYLANPDVLVGSLRLLSEARNLVPRHAGAAVVFASAAIETALKVALLKPIVGGLVHNERFAELLATLITGQASNLQKLQKLIFRVVKEHAQIDLATFKPDCAKSTLWKEILKAQKRRNEILHRGDTAALADAKIAVSTAQVVLETIFAKVLASVELHLCGDRILCRS
jgi:hypothetical protein